MAVDSELTAAEKRLLLAFQRQRGDGARVREYEYAPAVLAELTGTNEDAVMQAAFTLAKKGLCVVKEQRRIYYRLTPEGEEYAADALPERKALRLLLQHEGATSVEYLKHALGKRVNIAINWLLRKNWAYIDNGRVIPTVNAEPPYGADEEILRSLALAEGQSELKPETKQEVITQLISRRLVVSSTRVERRIGITDAGMELLERGLSIEEEIAQLTPEIIRTWKGRRFKFKRYDVDISGREIFAAKLHPYQRILDRMRKIFTEMGFIEIKGEHVQSAFWNFDALFVPQDHPAREMQDTFYLGLKRPIDASEELIKRVKEMHEHGGPLNSSGWGGEWRREQGEELLLRTHTTAVTVKYLASHPEPPVKVFCIGRVYRRETIDPTHIPEFDQLEGIIMDRDVTFANLLGCLAVFYRKMGFPSIRFRPGYFPYTEPSVEVEVYTERGWIELGGAGIFREEVTHPIGVKYPVLAWGLGIGRLAMISLGLSDIRDLYQPDIDWLRRAWLLPRSEK
ncbi:MAG: phenylalanine--tRNA ligase subunit alpha [Candidatus Methanophagaceae archaeon]|nr:MAG: phenylalanine--tRNA ligase subunit alpha [Methanophagales archaeon]